MTMYQDVLGRTFNVPDPVSVAALARCYQGTAQDVGDAQAKLSALASPQAWVGWTGQAADTFSSKIGVLPRQLGQAYASYRTVAWALADYAAQLEPVVAALTTLISQAEDAQGMLDSTAAARDLAIQQGQDPQATGWDTRLAEARSNVSCFEGRLGTLLGELSRLSQQSVSRIRQAQAEGIQNNAVTELQVAGLVTGGVLVGAIKTAWNIGDDVVVHPFAKLAHDLTHMDANRPFLSWAAVAGDLAGVLAVLALLVPGVGEVALPFILGLEDTALALDILAEVHQERGADRQGQQDSLNLVITLATAGIGRVLGGALTQDTENLANGADANTSAQSLLKSGVQHFFSQDDVLPAPASETPPTVLQALTSQGNTFLRAGADPLVSHSAAGVVVENLQFTVDRANDAYTVYGTQQEKGQAPWQ